MADSIYIVASAVRMPVSPMLEIFDRLGTTHRVAIALIGGALTYLASWSTFPKEEALFWAVVVTIATGMFLLVKQQVSLRERFKRVGLWDLFVPAVLMLVVTVTNPQGLTESVIRDNSLRLVFAVIFFVGVGTAFRIVFRAGKHD